MTEVQGLPNWGKGSGLGGREQDVLDGFVTGDTVTIPPASHQIGLPLRDTQGRSTENCEGAHLANTSMKGLILEVKAQGS